MTERVLDHVPAHGQGRLLTPWQKGQSGNPGGINKALKEATALARAASPDAIRRLIELMRDADSRVAAVACNSVLDRGLGKVRDLPPEDAARGVPDLSGLSPEQMQALRAALLVVRGMVAAAPEILPAEDQTSP